MIKVLRAVIYCRVSTKDQVENLSLATQEQACRAYCEREGLDVERVFVEEGESAKTTQRTQLRQMKEFCRTGRSQISHIEVDPII